MTRLETVRAVIARRLTLGQAAMRHGVSVAAVHKWVCRVRAGETNLDTKRGEKLGRLPPVETLREMRGQGMLMQDIADRYGVSLQSVSNMLLRDERSR